MKIATLIGARRDKQNSNRLYLLFTPTKNAVNLLKKEGLYGKAYFSGDMKYDSILFKINLRKTSTPSYKYYP